jgi:hypothetical protein
MVKYPPGIIPATDAEELEVGHFHPFANRSIRVLSIPHFAGTTPRVGPGTVRLRVPEKSYSLAAVDRSAHMDAGNGKVLGTVLAA